MADVMPGDLTGDMPSVCSVPRRLIAGCVVTIAALFALGLPSPASAADVTMTAPRGVSNFPTWFFGRTTLCFDNHKGDYWQGFELTTWLGYYETVIVQAHAQSCITRSWAGSMVRVADFGPSQGIPVRVYNAYGPN